MPVTTLDPLNCAAAPAPSMKRVCAEDAAALSAFLQGLSIHSRRLRFHGACAAASPSLAMRLCNVDGARHQAWLAWSGCGGAAVVVGEARFVVSACGRSAELAIVVADNWQGRGVAHGLMRSLLAAAIAAGVSDLHGDVLGDNPRMQAFMRRHGFALDASAQAYPCGDVLRMARDLRVSAPRPAPLPAAGRLLAGLRSALPGLAALLGVRGAGRPQRASLLAGAQTTPCASIASATFTKPATLAPST